MPKDRELTAQEKASIESMNEEALIARDEWDKLMPELDRPTLDKIAKFLKTNARYAGWRRTGKIVAGID